MTTFVSRTKQALTELAVHFTVAESGVLFDSFCDPFCIGFQLKMVANYATIFGLIPLYAPIYKQRAISEAIDRANWGLYFGTFEHDWRNGQLRYRASVWAPDGQISDDQLRKLIQVSVANVSFYAPAFGQVICSDTEPDVCIARVDAQLGSHLAITDDDIPF